MLLGQTTSYLIRQTHGSETIYCESFLAQKKIVLFSWICPCWSLLTNGIWLCDRLWLASLNKPAHIIFLMYFHSSRLWKHHLCDIRCAMCGDKKLPAQFSFIYLFIYASLLWETHTSVVCIYWQWTKQPPTFQFTIFFNITTRLTDTCILKLDVWYQCLQITISIIQQSSTIPSPL